MHLAFCLALLAPNSAEAQNRVQRRRPRQINVRAAARTAAKAVVANLRAADAGEDHGPKPDALIAVTPEGSTDAALIEQVHARFDQDAAARKRLAESEGQPEPAKAPADQPRVMVDMAHYGVQYGQPAPTRYFALHLLCDNPTGEAATVSRADISAKVDGVLHPLGDIPDNLKHISFPYGAQHQNVQLPEQVKQIQAPAHGVGGSWILLGGLPMNSDVPSLALTVKIGNRTPEVDVTASQQALLDLRAEAMGPRDCLRLLTIHGLINSVNLQSLIAELESFSERKTVRFVLQFAEGAPAPDQQLSYWLVNSAAQLGVGRPVNDQFPSFPALVREFHFVQPAGNNFPNTDQYGRQMNGLRMHATAADAVAAALKSAFIALPPQELLAAIQEGSPLARAAALRHGAGRLNAGHLPIILKLTEDPHAEIQSAAVRALCDFGEPASQEALVRLARSQSESLSTTAIESLASSRYAVAHSALLELLRTDDPALKKRIMQVLARYPRPQWSPTIYAYVTDPQEKLPIEGVRALLHVGHPQLVDVLEAGLNSPDKATRELVFPVLASRTDVRSERLATQYALKQLEQQPPDGTVIQFLHRTKLAAALPLLLKHLDTAPDKGSIINLLAQIGDESVGDALVAKYEKLQNHEKSMTLNALRILEHNKFRGLAGEAILTSDSGLISQATQGLIQDGSPEACHLLITALEKQTNAYAVSNICNALANIGLPEAREALLKARESENQQTKNYAINALNYLRQRSPGYQYIWQAQAHSQQKKWKDALEYFDLAVELDPDLPEAYAGRGSMKVRLGKSKEAVKDFEKAYELDPYNALAASSLAVLRVQDGKIEEGLKLIESNRERNQHDGNYLYNSACVYSQAMDQIAKQKDIPDRDQRREEYRKKALSELQAAISRGFADFDWMREDPDFKPLADDAEFKKIIGNRPTKPQDQPADAADVISKS